MRAKPPDDRSNIFQWLFECGDEALGNLAHDLRHGGGFPDGLSKLIDKAARTKGRVGKNVEALLHLLNLPSRSDYNRLVSKVERLQGSLVNLSMKLDRLLAGQQSTSKTKKRTAKSEHL
jgi:hypothetical protein